MLSTMKSSLCNLIDLIAGVTGSRKKREIERGGEEEKKCAGGLQKDKALDCLSLLESPE